MKVALDKGRDLLAKGESAVTVVEQVVKILEDSPLFNAGRGAITNMDGIHELDASIMDGSNRKAGAVAAVKGVKNPIAAARAVMDKSDHVLLVGTGAETFAKKQNVDMVKPSYFSDKTDKDQASATLKIDDKFGTVGAAVLDRCGNLASGTSTGGYKTKLPGRVGDSPIIGAGTYADNETASLSATGHGEFFIRYAVTHSITKLMDWKDMKLQDAAEHMIKKTLVDAGGKGGIIGIDKNGEMVAVYNTKAMIHGMVSNSKDAVVNLK